MALSSGTEEMGAITAAVVAHDPLHFNAQRSEVSQGAFEEEDSAVLAFIGHDLSKGEAGSVIDANMDVFPTGAAHLIASIVGHAVAGADNAAELFDVEVEEFSGVLPLVAHDWRSGLQGTQPSEPVAPEQARDGGAREPTLARDLEAGQTQPAQSQDDRHLRRRSLAWMALRSRRTIAQAGGALGSETGDPFPHAALRKTDLESGGLGRELISQNRADDPFSTSRRESRIMVNVHVAVGFDGLDVFTPSTLANPSPHEQPIETSQLDDQASQRVSIKQGAFLTCRAIQKRRLAVLKGQKRMSTQRDEADRRSSGAIRNPFAKRLPARARYDLRLSRFVEINLTRFTRACRNRCMPTRG